MIEPRWPRHLHYRAFIAPAQPRLDVLSSVDRGEDDQLVQLGTSRPATLVNLRPNSDVVALEHLSGEQRDLSQIRLLPRAAGDGLLTCSIACLTRCRLLFDEQSALLEFVFGDGPRTHAHSVSPPGQGVLIYFDDKKRCSGILFTDVVFDDTLASIEAWSRQHGFSED